MRRALAALCALAVLLFGLSARAQLLSPGPLSKAHASLEGDTHCSSCHSSGKRVDQAACLRCHTELGTRIAGGLGLHGRQYKGQPCEQCHVEHLGVNATPIKWPSGGASSLDHAQTGWPLDGAHRIACNRCHTKMTPTGTLTYLGLTQACGSCHKDPHTGRFGTTCTECHNTTAWPNLDLRTFNHDKARFPLHGSHATVACASCHQGTPPKYTGLAFAACTDCHRDPHAGKLGASCTDCHDETKWKPVTFKTANAKHPGVSLANGHAAVACGTCHDRGNLVAPSRGSACVSCHKPVHKAPFGNACGNCHGLIVWLGLPRSIGIAAHVKTDYPLTGKHEDVSCTSCHKTNVPRDQRFRHLTFGKCLDCHQDKHSGEFARLQSGECSPCHSTAGFRPTLFGVDEHATQAKYALVGKHTATPCSACHGTARPTLDLHVAKQACADCHANPHGDQFATQMQHGGCAECHAPSGWHQPKVDHSIWPLTGAHGTAPCESCHHPTDADRKAGHGPSYRGVTRQCSGCHDDAHLGQFRLTAPVLECDTCHTTRNFKIPGFDHGKLTKWGLTGAHAKLECAKCHPSATVASTTTTRWRTPSHECTFCHANPHNERLRAPVGVAATVANTKSFADSVPCTACHSTTAWRASDASGEGVHFDHSKTGFPLTGEHMKTSCVQCHKSAIVKRECASCHTDAHFGRLSEQCDKCHSPAGWKVTRPLELHRMTRFPLTGMHVLADCTQCHVRANEQRFTDAPIECWGCHQQDYQRPGIFPHQATASTPALPRDCSLCHRAVGWVPANVPGSSSSMLSAQKAPADHDLRFPITWGLHRGAGCNDCHVALTAPRAVRCIGCHQHDPTVLAQQHRQPIRVGSRAIAPMVVPMDGASCLSCHPAGVRR